MARTSTVTLPATEWSRARLPTGSTFAISGKATDGKVNFPDRGRPGSQQASHHPIRTLPAN